MGEYIYGPWINVLGSKNSECFRRFILGFFFFIKKMYHFSEVLKYQLKPCRPQLKKDLQPYPRWDYTEARPRQLHRDTQINKSHWNTGRKTLDTIQSRLNTIKAVTSKSHAEIFWVDPSFQASFRNWAHCPPPQNTRYGNFVWKINKLSLDLSKLNFQILRIH